MVKKLKENYFDIHSMIAKGKADVREYELPAGKVFYRPLSQLEIEKAEFEMFGVIKDAATREYIFNKAEENALNDVPRENDTETFNGIPSEVDITQFLNAMIVRDINIVATAIRDFTEDFDKNDLVRLDGIQEFAEEVLRVSGSTPEAQEDIENFR